MFAEANSSRVLQSSDSFQVVLQGTPLNYDDSQVLDKLEYALRHGSSASERHLSQPDVLPKIAVS